MSRSQVQVEFSDFSGGHYSSLGPFNSPKNMFGGTNCQVYKNGTVGARPGFKTFSLNSGTYPSPTTGTFYRAFWSPAADASTYPKGWFWIIHGTAGIGRRIDVDAAAASTYNGPINTDILDSTDDHGKQVVVWANPTSVCIAGDSIVNPDTAATVATNYDGGGWPGSDVPDASAFYKDRQYFWGTQADNRIYYSEAQGSGASGADLFFHVGPGGSTTTRWRVVNAWPLRNGLLICMQEYKGDSYGIWYMLSGASPESGTLREIDRGRRPAHELGAVLWKDAVWFVPTNGRGVSFHDGQHLNDSRYDYLRPFDEWVPQGYEGTITPKPGAGLTLEPGVVLPFSVDVAEIDTPSGEAAVVDAATDWWRGSNGFEFVNGIWTKSAYYMGHGDTSAQGQWYGIADMSEFERDKLMVLYTDGGDGEVGGTVFEIQTRDLTLNRPANTNDTWSGRLWDEASQNDSNYTSDMVFRTHGWEPPPGARCRIVELQLDVDYWDDSAGNAYYGNPFIDRIRVRHYGQIDANTTTYDDDEYAFDLFGDSALNVSDWAEITGDMPNRRIHKMYPDYNYWHGPFRLEFMRVRNIAFRRIIVTVEVDDQGARR